MARPFSQQHQRVRPSSKEDAVVTRAQEHFERTLVRVKGELVGSVAALDHPRRSGEANYGEVFLRDNVPVMVYLLLQGRFEVVRNFLAISLELQSNDTKTRGVFPTSFVEENGVVVADYGQRSIGRITSVDASLWWPILCWLYVKHSRDVEFGASQQVQRGVQLLLDLVLHPTFEGTPVLFVPDCAFMIDRPMDVWGNPLEVEVLLYGCLRSCCQLMELAQRDRQSRLLHQRIELTREWMHDLRSFLLKHYWVTSKTVQVLRPPPHGAVRRPPARERVQRAAPGDPPLAAGLDGEPWRLPDRQHPHGATRFSLLQPGEFPGLPVRADHRSAAAGPLPPGAPQPRTPDGPDADAHLSSTHEADEWMNKTGSDPKNWPWSYHNGGHWPSLLWYLAGAVLLHEQRHPTADVLLMGQMRAMLEECYWAQLNQLPRQQWAEYFDGPTGTWVGQQARTYQTWTIVGFLLLHHMLRVNPAQVSLIDIEGKPGS